MANKQRQYDCKANSKGAVNTVSLLVIFLLSIAAFVLGSLYFELRYKNQLLLDEVAELKDSQILFMVPDEQAEVMANWMAENPVFVESFVARARGGELTSMPIGDGSVEQLIQTSIEQSVHSDAANNLATDKKKNSRPFAPLSIDSDEATEPSSHNRLMQQDNSSNASSELVTAKLNGKGQEINITEDKMLIASSDMTEQSPNGVAEEMTYTLPDKAQMVNITEEGVKLISLPHGGIRITTRALEE